MKVYIIGTGMDGAGTLTKRGSELIEGAGLLIGAERMLRPFSGLVKESVTSYDPEEISGIIKEKALNCPEGFYAVYLVSGDCSFYSGARRIAELLRDGAPKVSVEMVPGISSLSYFCAAAGTSMEDIRTVSLHGRNASIAVKVRTSRRVFFLLGGRTGVSVVCSRLCDYGMPDVRVIAGENLGIPGERITRGTARELCSADTGKLAVMLVENDAAPGYVPSGIADDCFIRGGCPMTKSDVRALIQAALHIKNDDICWDVGCGTGSVSVEMAYRCTDGRVYAFDKSEEAIRLTTANAKRFGCDNISVVLEDFPRAGAGYEKPDKIFIGGSEGRLEDIIRLAAGLNPHVRIAVTAVTLDTLYEARRLLKEYAGGCSIKQVSTAHVERVGHSEMLRAFNPVFLIAGGGR